MKSKGWSPRMLHVANSGDTRSLWTHNSKRQKEQHHKVHDGIVQDGKRSANGIAKVKKNDLKVNIDKLKVSSISKTDIFLYSLYFLYFLYRVPYFSR